MNPRVYVGGTFDLFHAGHVELLRQADKLGEVHVVVNTDAYVEDLKGKAPVMDTLERATVLLACEYVMAVYWNDNSEADLLDLIRPNVIAYANDGSYTRESYLDLFGLTEADLDRLGIQLVFLDYTEGVSSTDIVARILQRHSGEPRERAGSSEDAREPDVPDAASGRDDRPGLGSGCPCDDSARGGVCRCQLEDLSGPPGLGPCQASGGPCPCS